MYGYFDKQEGYAKAIDAFCQKPNIGYHFEEKFGHIIFYKDSFSYVDGVNGTRFSELAGIDERNFGVDKAKMKCLQLLLRDREIMYKTIIDRNLRELNQSNAGWVD